MAESRPQNESSPVEQAERSTTGMPAGGGPARDGRPRLQTGITDEVEFLRSQLSRLGLPASEFEALVVLWRTSSVGPLVSFFVQKGRIDRTTAKLLEAMRKGYVSAPNAVPLPAAAPPVAREADPPAAAPPERAPSGPRPVVEPAAGDSAEILVERALPDLPPAAAAPGAAPELREGAKFGRYVLEERLGSGATATIFRAFHDMLHIPVAIKIFKHMSEGDGATPSARQSREQRFLDEAQTLARLDHPSIVRVLDVAVREGVPYIVFEYIGELSLEDMVGNIGRLPPERVGQIGIEVADALGAASAQGLLHRDVKPANILLRKDGHVKLADFGIATTVTAEGLTSDPSAQEGRISGTPAYMAPESIVSPATIDARADMYSLGATLYHAATGSPPLERADAYQTLKAQLEEAPPPLLSVEPGFAPELAAVIMRLLEKRPDDRYASWDEVQGALRRALPTRRRSLPEISGLRPGPGGEALASPPHALRSSPEPRSSPPLPPAVVAAPASATLSPSLRRTEPGVPATASALTRHRPALVLTGLSLLLVVVRLLMWCFQKS